MFGDNRSEQPTTFVPAMASHMNRSLYADCSIVPGHMCGNFVREGKFTPAECHTMGNNKNEFVDLTDG